MKNPIGYQVNKLQGVVAMKNPKTIKNWFFEQTFGSYKGKTGIFRDFYRLPKELQNWN